MISPTPYTLSQLLKTDPFPFASGGYGGLHEGTLDGSKICVKCVRVYTQDILRRAAEVLFPSLRFPCSSSLTKFAAPKTITENPLRKPQT